MARRNNIPRAQSAAVYRGREVSTFAHDLSNYSQLRRGLSPAMRSQTLTKKELSQVSPDKVEAYIDALNQWRTSPQLEKVMRAQEIAQSPLEQIFQSAARSEFYSAQDKAAFLTANLKLKTMTAETAQKQIKESLNLIDRLRGADFYKAKYYLDNDTFDPELASNDMLREVVITGYIENYPEAAAAAKAEYMKRLGEVNAGALSGSEEMASEANAYRKDLLGIAKSLIGKKQSKTQS